MNLMGLFRSPQNELEKGGKPVPEEDAGIRTTCPHCGVQLPLNDLQDNLQVCTACGYHFRMGPGIGSSTWWTRRASRSWTAT